MSSTERSLKVDGVTLKGTSEPGAGSVPMIWAHCMGGCRASEDVEGFFKWRTDCIESLTRFDCRGHGESGCGKEAEQHTFASLGRDLIDLVNQVHGKESPVILGGASMGSAASLHAGVLLSNRVKALVLCIPPPCYEKRTQKRNFMDALGDSFLKPSGYEKYLAMNRATRPIHLFAEAGKKHTWEAPAFTSAETASLVVKGAALSDFPPRNALRALQTPAIILAWEHDTMHPLDSAQELHDLLPNSELHVAKTFEDLQQWPDLVQSFIIRQTGDQQHTAQEMEQLDVSLLPAEEGRATNCCCCLVS